jgi:hypothetical protein
MKPAPFHDHPQKTVEDAVSLLAQVDLVRGMVRRALERAAA